MKRIVSSVLAASILLAPGLAAAEETVNVKINYKDQNFEQPAVKVNGRTMVPLRAIFESLGVQVAWDEETQSVSAVKGPTTITLQINSTTATKNGQPVVLDQAPTVIHDRIMVPIRFVSESLGAEVLWNEETQTVNILSIENHLDNLIEKGDISKIKELLAMGVDLNNGKFIRNPVLTTIWYDQPEILKLLIENGASVNPKLDPDYQPPLLCAIALSGGNGKINNVEVKPVHSKEIVDILLSAMADPNGTNFVGVTPLMEAAILNDKEWVQKLIDAGADLNLKDRDNHNTALQWAIDWGHKEIADLLRKAGAKE